MMKRVFLILSVFMLLIQQTALCGVPIKIRTIVVNEPIRGQFLENINATVDGNTITIDFLADFGSVDIFIETISGSLVAGTTCPITPGQAEVQVSGIYPVNAFSSASNPYQYSVLALNNSTNNKKWFFPLAILLALPSCLYNTDVHDYNQVHKERTITIDSLHSLLCMDSTLNKLVLFYDPCCLPCVMSIDSFLRPFISSEYAKDFQFWLISDYSYFIEESDNFLYQHGIPPSKVNSFNLRKDTCSLFTYQEDHQWDNIVNAMFSSNKLIHGTSGLPLYLK